MILTLVWKVASNTPSCFSGPFISLTILALEVYKVHATLAWQVITWYTSDLTRFTHSQSQWRMQKQERARLQTTETHRSILPFSRPPWQSSHRPCVERKGKSWEGGGMAWGEDLWGTFITTLHCPGEARGEGWGQRGKTFPFPFLFFACTGATRRRRGWRSLSACSAGGGREVVFLDVKWVGTETQGSEYSANAASYAQ